MKIRRIEFKNAIFRNLWLKILSLAVAVIVWLYVSGAMTKGIFST
ncbi:MAG: hypothetical protein PHP69_03490 [Candidatus Omnitrophica bacterium]|nr:hypothetical protein [Candidatus Omnitrophota bacterium]MDD5081145.1 hypothetical protein [Candidatus Omnitrophota bacterium]